MNSEWNRREEHRHDRFGRLMGWRLENSRRKRRKGWMSDVSPSGLSFLVGTPCRPKLGEDLEVHAEADGARGLYHVVRLRPLEGNLTLVGCRKDPPARARIHTNPSLPIHSRQLTPRLQSHVSRASQPLSAPMQASRLLKKQP